MQRISGLNSSMSHIACYFFFHSLSLKTKSLRLPHIPSLFCHHILLVSCPSVFARSSLWVARPGSCLCQASIKPISCEGSDPPRSYLLPCGLRKKKKKKDWKRAELGCRLLSKHTCKASNHSTADLHTCKPLCFKLCMRGPAQFYLIKCAPLHLLEFLTEQQEQRRDDIFFSLLPLRAGMCWFVDNKAARGGCMLTAHEVTVRQHRTAWYERGFYPGFSLGGVIPLPFVFFYCLVFPQCCSFRLQLPVIKTASLLCYYMVGVKCRLHLKTAKIDFCKSVQGPVHESSQSQLSLGSSRCTMNLLGREKI